MEMGWGWRQNLKILQGWGEDGHYNHGDAWGWGRKCVPVQLSTA